MRNAIIAACCVAFIGGISAASAQTTGPVAKDSMNTNSPMDAQAKMMKKKKMKHHMKKSDSMGTKKDGMMKDGMKKDGMSK